jgi:SAM-dependent methyltransferase
MRPMVLLRACYKQLRQYRKTWIEARVKKLLLGSSELAFTSDWFSRHIPNWELHLVPLQGQTNLQTLEIGSFEGRSALWLLEHLNCQLTCIDPFLGAGTEIRFDHNVALRQLTTRVTKLKGFSEDVLPNLNQTFDLIYIDGNHSAASVLLDAVLSWRLLKPKGMMIFDDYLWQHNPRVSQRPKLGIDLFLESIQGQFSLLHKGYQIIIQKKEATSVAS